jgi:hypothetical protein
MNDNRMMFCAVYLLPLCYFAGTVASGELKRAVLGLADGI